MLCLAEPHDWRIQRQYAKKLYKGIIFEFLCLPNSGSHWDFFGNLLPDELVRHIGPGLIAYTSKSVMIFVVPLVLFVVHVTVCLKSEWFKPVTPKWRFWQIPIVSIFIFLISVIFVVLV